MFLRGPLASRLPVAILRLRGSSAPSTSTSTSLFSTSNHAQSRGHNHVIPTSVPQLARHFGASLVCIRGGNDKGLRGVEGARTEDTNNNKSDKRGGNGSDSDGFNKTFKQAMSGMTKLGVFFIVVNVVFEAINRYLSIAGIPPDAVQVDLDTFLEKYLRAGEVEKITYVSLLDKAVCTLQPEAIIDGNPVGSKHVVVECKGGLHFRNAVRKVESELGLSMSQSVPIEFFATLARYQNLFNLGCLVVALPLSVLQTIRNTIFKLRK